MGLFDFGKKEEPNKSFGAIELLEKHSKKEMDTEDFWRSFKGATVFYSTPFGDHKDGGKRVFLLAGPDNTGYLPAFSSNERLMEFYENAGRVGYMIMNGTFLSMLETTRSVNEKAPVKMGVIIDPGYYGVAIDASKLDAVIGMIK